MIDGQPSRRFSSDAVFAALVLPALEGVIPILEDADSSDLAIRKLVVASK